MDTLSLPYKNELNDQDINKDINWHRFNSSMLIEVQRGSEFYTSSAVAISRNVLLTAAHSVDCLDGANALIGKSYITSYEKIKVKRVIIHPGYNPSKSFYENDLALVILDSNLPSHLCFESLIEDYEITSGDLLERVGFGGRKSRNRRAWTSPTFQMKTFSQKNFILADSDSVIGDSGGPIYKSINGKLELIGIHSTLEGEDKTYIVNLSKYKSWVESNLPIRQIN